MHGHHMHHSFDFFHRPKSSDDSANEVLAKRVHHIAKTIGDLRSKLAVEKELLQREKMMSASMFLIPTCNDYYTLAYPTTENDRNWSEDEIGLQRPNKDSFETLYNCNAVVTENKIENKCSSSFQTTELDPEQVSNLLKHIDAYRKHLKSVEQKCKHELGAVEDSICNLKGMSADMNQNFNEELKYMRGEEPDDFKNELYDSDS